MTWTQAETVVLSSLVSALTLAGMVDVNSSTAKSSDCLFARDFLDNKALQKGKSFCVYSPLPEDWSESADNSKIYRSVSSSVWIATTSSPKSSKVIDLRESFEAQSEAAGFRVKFIQSGFDDSTKLYVFEYKLVKEIADA